jgi:hypothetical protein
MSFPRNSAFDQGAGIVPEGTPATEEIRAELKAAIGPIRHVGRPNIVEVPLDVLERWINDLEGIEGDNAADVLPDLLLEMRSRFRG